MPLKSGSVEQVSSVIHSSSLVPSRKSVDAIARSSRWEPITKGEASVGAKSQSRLDDTVVFAIPIFQPVRLDLDQKKSRGLNALWKPAFQIFHPVVIEHAAIADK